MEIFNDLGLLDRFLQRPHERMETIAVRFGGKRLDIADFATLNVAAPYIAFMPQWEFLDFLADEARRLPAFELVMNGRFDRLAGTAGGVTGVIATTPEGTIEIASRLVIGADGRDSGVRRQAGLPLREVGAPIDVLWFSVPRRPGPFDDVLIHADAGQLMVTIDRGTYWQCAYVIAKGGNERIRAGGLPAFRASVARIAPALAGEVGALADWGQVKLLTVKVDRLERWSAPGLLCIGDAAHAMSPIGGVGINLAIQDAVAAANLLAPVLLREAPSLRQLDAVRRRRLWPARITQFVQVQAQNRILAPLIAGGGDAMRPPLPLRLIARSRILQRWAARAVGLGARPERVKMPAKA